MFLLKLSKKSQAWRVSLDGSGPFNLAPKWRTVILLQVYIIKVHCHFYSGSMEENICGGISVHILLSSGTLHNWLDRDGADLCLGCKTDGQTHIET